MKVRAILEFDLENEDRRAGARTAGTGLCASHEMPPDGLSACAGVDGRLSLPDHGATMPIRRAPLGTARGRKHVAFGKDQAVTGGPCEGGRR